MQYKDTIRRFKDIYELDKPNKMLEYTYTIRGFLGDLFISDKSAIKYYEKQDTPKKWKQYNGFDVCPIWHAKHLKEGYFMCSGYAVRFGIYGNSKWQKRAAKCAKGYKKMLDSGEEK